MSPTEMQEELEAARAEIAHLKVALQGTQQWVDRLLKHCKQHNVPTSARDLLGDEGWLNQTKEPT